MFRKLGVHTSAGFGILILTLVALAIAGAKIYSDRADKQARALACDSASSVKMMLNCLVVESESETEYPEDFGGSHWNHDGTCKSTRVEVLIRESLIPVQESRNCRELSGRWLSTYDNKSAVDPSDHRIEIDHTVSKKEAWQSGAASWTDDQRKAYKNDLGYAASLIAVTGSVNQSKREWEPHEWMPKVEKYRCAYLADWIAVKYRWSLSVDSVEHAFLVEEIDDCDSELSIEIPQRVQFAS